MVALSNLLVPRSKWDGSKVCGLNSSGPAPVCSPGTTFRGLSIVASLHGDGDRNDQGKPGKQLGRPGAHPGVGSGVWDLDLALEDLAGRAHGQPVSDPIRCASICRPRQVRGRTTGVRPRSPG